MIAAARDAETFEALRSRLIFVATGGEQIISQA